MQIAAAPQVSDLEGHGQNLRVCISDQLPGDTELMGFEWMGRCWDSLRTTG